jgi:hypothetical protein
VAVWRALAHYQRTTQRERVEMRHTAATPEADILNRLAGVGKLSEKLFCVVCGMLEHSRKFSVVIPVLVTAVPVGKLKLKHERHGLLLLLVNSCRF